MEPTAVAGGGQANATVMFFDKTCGAKNHPSRELRKAVDRALS